MDLRHHSDDNDFNNKTAYKTGKDGVTECTLRWFIWVGINPHTATLTYPGERLYILQLTHVYLLLTSQKVGLHNGIVRMKGLARCYLWWPGLDADIEEKIKDCETCQSVRNLPPEAPMHPWTWPTRCKKRTVPIDPFKQIVRY